MFAESTVKDVPLARAEKLRKQGKLDQAIACYHDELLCHRESLEAHLGLAGCYVDMGNFVQAQATLEAALTLYPGACSAWVMLTQLRKMTLADAPWLETAQHFARQPDIPREDLSNLYFAMGKYYDDTRQYDLAFAAFKHANALRRATAGGLDRTNFAVLIDSLIEVCTEEFFTEREVRSSSQRPVLVVGMPRSGTSLVEQIIASHPQAAGAGELLFWYSLFHDHLPTILAGEEDGVFATQAIADYEKLLGEFSADALRVVDKMPQNFMWICLAHAFFPHAKIIHVRRNPVDTCLSIYTQNFHQEFTYATDLDDLNFYYRQYARLMDHWRKVLPPGSFMELRYEDLVDDQARYSRELIEFIGLEWDEACLDFHTTARKVGTASNWQVRQKIYRTSQARWRNYQPHLQPLMDLLELE